MLLDSTTDNLEIILGAAIVTNQLPFIVSFNDYDASTVTPTKNVSTTNGTTAVNLIASPSASHQRQLRYCSVYNVDTVQAAVTIRFNDNGTTRNVFITTLLPGESIQYTYEVGWRVFDSNGFLKVTGINLQGGTIRLPEFFAAANGSTTLTLASGTDYCFYLGKADRAINTVAFLLNVTTALGATITWAEVAIYKGTPTIGANATLTPRCGYTDVSTIINATGVKAINVAVSGINAGDDIWVVIGTVTSGTACQVRAGLADDVGGGFIQTLTGSTRPSTNNSLSPTLQTGTACIWWEFSML